MGVCQKLVRERLLVLGEEDVAADVGAKALATEAPGKPSSAVVGLQHLDVAPEKISREKAGNTAADDDGFTV